MRAGLNGTLGTALVATLLVAIALTFTLRVAVPAAREQSVGFLAYYVAAQAVRAREPGSRLYDDEWFAKRVLALSHGRITDVYLANPPALAVAWLPFAYLSVDSARRVWIAISVVCLIVAVWMIAAELEWSRSPWALIAMTSVFLLSAPTREEFRLGQMYVFLLFLHAIGWRSYPRGQDATAGGALGLAMALKISGWPIGLLMVAQHRWRALLWAIATAAAMTMVSLPFVGFDAWRALVLQEIPDVLHAPFAALPVYQDTTGFWQHLFRYDATTNANPLYDIPALAGVLTLLTTVIACYALVRSRRPPSIRFAAAIALTELLSPAAEQYHYVVLFLPLALLWKEAWTLRNRALGLSALLATLLIVGPIAYKAPHSTWNILMNYPRLIGGWVIFATLLIPARSERLTEPPVDGSSAGVPQHGVVTACK